MQLDVPFYLNTNDGNQCMQVTMQGVLDYFLHLKKTVDELDVLTGRKKGYWTYTTQVVGALWEMGLDVKMYSVDPLEPYTHDVASLKQYIRETYPNQFETIMKMSDLPMTIVHSTKLKQMNLFEQRKLSFTEIENHIMQGHVPLMLIDHSVLEDENGNYRGHFVVVTGFGENTITYHESGPKNPAPHRCVSKEQFIRAWDAPGTGNDVIIVLGKREK